MVFFEKKTKKKKKKPFFFLVVAGRNTKWNWTLKRMQWMKDDNIADIHWIMIFGWFWWWRWSSSSSLSSTQSWLMFWFDLIWFFIFIFPILFLHIYFIFSFFSFFIIIIIEDLLYRLLHRCLFFFGFPPIFSCPAKNGAIPFYLFWLFKIQWNRKRKMSKYI